MLTCVVCGSQFEAQRRTAKTCSGKCRATLFRWKHADIREKNAALRTIHMLSDAANSVEFRDSSAHMLYAIYHEAGLAINKLSDDYGIKFLEEREA